MNQVKPAPISAFLRARSLWGRLNTTIRIAILLPLLFSLQCSGIKDQPDPRPFEAVENDLFLRGDLHRFYAKLEKLQKEKKGVIRVLFFGDSVIWGDCLTVRLKRDFQRDFGDGGRGLLRLVDWAPTRLMDHSNLTSGAFEKKKIPFESFQIPTFPDLGFTGFSYRPFREGGQSVQAIAPRTGNYDVRHYQKTQKTHPDWPTIDDVGPPRDAKFGTDGESWNRLQLILRSGGQPANLHVRYEDETGQWNSQKKEVSFSGGCQSVEFAIPGARKVEVTFMGRPWIDGMAVETDAGVSFSSIVMRGLHQAWLLGVPEAQMQCGYRAYKPDLIIFQFGINESQTLHYAVEGFTAEKYEGQLRRLYGRLQKAVPEASILVLGPWDRLLKQNGSFQPYQAHTTVRQIQKRVAHDLNLAYFDGYIFFERTGGIRKAVSRGLIQMDYTHVTYPGGHYVADALYNQLIDDYRAWLQE